MIRKVLIVAINEQWSGISRLPAALARNGFEVSALCPKASYLAKTRYLSKALRYPTFSYSRSKVFYLFALLAILILSPDIIVQADEESLLVLQNLDLWVSNIPFLGRVRETLKRSLPQYQDGSVFLSKSKFIELCGGLGIKVPYNRVLSDEADFNSVLKEVKYPIVLKSDAGYGGSGVVICHDEKELVAAYHRFVQTSFMAKAKGWIRDLLFINLRTGQTGISLQEYFEGQVGQAPFVAIDGKVIAMNTMFKTKTYPGTTGPSSVVEGFFSKELTDLVLKGAQHLKYNGFGSFEFIYNAEKNEIKVIEFNPRPTPTCHFTEKMAVNDLCKALYAGYNNLDFKVNSNRSYAVAIFPNEKRRDPKSPYLQTAFHDIPTDDPDLLSYLDR